MQIVNRTRYATFDVELVLEQVKKLLRKECASAHPVRGVRLELRSTPTECCPLPAANGDLCGGYDVARSGSRVVVTVPPGGCHNRALGTLLFVGLAPSSRHAKRHGVGRGALNVGLVTGAMPHDFVIKPMVR